jgi:hypothetical protein
MLLMMVLLLALRGDGVGDGGEQGDGGTGKCGVWGSMAGTGHDRGEGRL